MKINKVTMLFEDLTPSDKQEMLSFTRSLVLDGKIANPLPDFVEQWFKEFEFGPDQRLLVMSTALPQRILLSLIESNQ